MWVQHSILHINNQHHQQLLPDVQIYHLTAAWHAQVNEDQLPQHPNKIADCRWWKGDAIKMWEFIHNTRTEGLTQHRRTVQRSGFKGDCF